jgi:Domain of unknown function (DUF6946)
MYLHYGKPEPVELEVLIHQMPEGEFRNLTRSTIPLLSYWRQSKRRLTELCLRLFGPSCPLGGDLCFEYPVKSVGRAKPSFSDLMYLTVGYAFAVEGKSTEPLSGTVRQWLINQGASASRQQVLNHWLSLIRQKTEVIDEPQIQDVVYQMLHRTASVCSTGRQQIAVVYQMFDVGESHGAYEAELVKLARAIGSEGKIGIVLQRIPTARTEFYRQTEDKVKGADQERRPLIIRDAVFGGRLFEFGGETVTVIAAAN